MEYLKTWIHITFCLLFASQGIGQQPPTEPTSAQKKAIMGNWEWTLALGPMRKRVSMEVLEKEGKLVAVVLLDDGTKLESKDFLFKGDGVRFTVRHEQGGRAMSMAHEGTLKDNKITGAANLTGGPIEMSTKWDASKVRKK